MTEATAAGEISVQFFFFFCILGLEVEISEEGNGTPLQYSCLENPMDGEAR